MQYRGSHLSEADPWGGKLLTQYFAAFPFHKLKIELYSSRLEVWSKIYHMPGPLLLRREWVLLAELGRKDSQNCLNKFANESKSYHNWATRDTLTLYNIAKQKLKFWF